MGYRGVHRVAGRPGLGVLDLAQGPAVNRDERILAQVNQDIGRYVVAASDARFPAVDLTGRDGHVVVVEVSNDLEMSS